MLLSCVTATAAASSVVHVRTRPRAARHPPTCCAGPGSVRAYRAVILRRCVRRLCLPGLAGAVKLFHGRPAPASPRCSTAHPAAHTTPPASFVMREVLLQALTPRGTPCPAAPLRRAQVGHASWRRGTSLTAAGQHAAAVPLVVPVLSSSPGPEGLDQNLRTVCPLYLWCARSHVARVLVFARRFCPLLLLSVVAVFTNALRFWPVRRGAARAGARYWWRY